VGVVDDGGPDGDQNVEGEGGGITGRGGVVVENFYDPWKYFRKPAVDFFAEGEAKRYRELEQELKIKIKLNFNFLLGFKNFGVLDNRKEKKNRVQTF
jgi:hypothetical protein